jgi:tRNA1Val (adenine37-N6)-methyltransferase
MLAQRSNAEQIDALEIDQLHTNKLSIILKTPWSDRLFCFHAGLFV